MHGVLN